MEIQLRAVIVLGAIVICKKKQGAKRCIASAHLRKDLEGVEELTACICLLLLVQLCTACSCGWGVLHMAEQTYGTAAKTSSRQADPLGSQDSCTSTL